MLVDNRYGLIRIKVGMVGGDPVKATLLPKSEPIVISVAVHQFGFEI